jgi:gamma-glutamyltranspeptidase / glutathione hydrolase
MKPKGVVAAGHPVTAQAAASILQLGGNAFDAAVAGVLAACVAESVLTSLAGGGFLLAHTAEGDNILFDFFTQTPQSKQISGELDFYPIEANFGKTVQAFHIGLGAMAVPGTWAGLVHVHQRLGRLPLAVVAEPAIFYAKTGIEVNPFQAYCYELLAPILMANAETRALYAPQGKLLQAGEILKMGDFATALHTLAKTGLAGFYQGDMANQLVADCQVRGGYLRLADLQTYQVIERNPLAFNYRGTTLLTNPPPSSGGALIAFCLALLAQSELSQLAYGSPEHLYLLSEAMRLTNVARRDGYDAQLHDPNIQDTFLALSHLERYYPEPWSQKWGSTTHLSVLDQEGNAASVTTSNGEGSAYIVPGTQIMVNNMLGEEDLNPQGFHQWQPGQRMSSMMAPSMILNAGRPQIVLGSGGSNRIRTAIVQVISNLLDFGMAPEAAVMASRIHRENDLFHLEPGFAQAELAQQGVLDDVQAIGWQQPNMFFGGVHTVGRSASGELYGVGDARRSGAVAMA